MSNLQQSVWATMQGLVDKVAGKGTTKASSKTAQMTAGNMPGGGKSSKMMSKSSGKYTMKDQSDKKMQPVVVNKLYTTVMPGEQPEEIYPEKQPVNKLYTTPQANEKGKVNAAYVAKLKANKKRPAPLKRKSQIRLPKAEWEALKESREAAKTKYAVRSKSVEQDMVFGLNAEKRRMKREAALKKAQKTPERIMNNCTMMYSVGPDPKYKKITRDFRKFRAFQKTKLQCAPKMSQTKIMGNFTFMYKVGSPIKAGK